MVIVCPIFPADGGGSSVSTLEPSWDASIVGFSKSVGAVGLLSSVGSSNIGDVEASPLWSVFPSGLGHHGADSNLAALVEEAATRDGLGSDDDAFSLSKV